MTARDRFSVNLSCPSCGATGTADLSEADGHAYLRGETSTALDRLDGPFDYEDHPQKYVFKCRACGVRAKTT
jgi:hypothetical protein